MGDDQRQGTAFGRVHVAEAGVGYLTLTGHNNRHLRVSEALRRAEAISPADALHRCSGPSR